MRRAWIAAVLAAASAVSAAPTEMITPPAGWHRDAEQASALAQRLAEAKLGTAAAEAYVADRPGVALFASRRTVDKPSDAGAIARTLLDDLRASARRAALSGAPAEETAWREGFDAASQAVTAELAWQDTAGHLETTARAVIASDGARLVAVTGECVASDGADRAARAACLHALETLQPDVPAGKRVAITLAAAGAAAPDAPASPTPTEAPAMRELPGASGLSDGSLVLPPQHVALDPPRDRQQPLVLIGGLIVLAAVFLWNRKRREQLARDDARRERGERARKRERPARDADADDLHAAARGDSSAPDEPTPP